MNTKQCSRCHLTYPIDSFTKNARYKDGHTTWCKSCMKEYQVRWAQENKEHMKKYVREWQIANPDKTKATQRRYYERHAERKRAQRKAYYWNNREAAQKKALAWSKTLDAETKRKYLRASIARHPDRQVARKAVTQQKESRHIPKASELPCICCHKPACHYHHYKSYSVEDRLAVVPVCISCHGMLHAGVLVLIETARPSWITSS